MKGQQDLFFDAEAYWGSRPYKCFVVTLESGRGRNLKRDRFNIRAKTEDRAIACAKRNSLLKGKISAFARLARPADLGATMPRRAA